MDANQLVAYNLKRARGSQTQELAAQRIRPYTGKPWSVASFSDAERSAENGRTREFDANELLAFARAFEKPIAWFFTPPDELESVYCGAPEDVSRTVSKAELLESIETSTLWDRVVMRDAIEKLRWMTNALEEIELRPMVQTEEPGGTVGVARNVSEEELKELREEEEED